MVLNSIIYNSIVDLFNIRQKPRVLQMPITSRCNSRCKTCNVWSLHEKVDIDEQMLYRALQDSYFSKVRAIGLNGGEITLVKNWKTIVSTILSLKRIKSLYIISNGLLPDKLLLMLSEIKSMCAETGVTLGFTLSIDGYGDIHDSVRGISGAFKKTQYLLDEIDKNPNTYFDKMIIGCTISKFNIPYIQEMELFFSNYDYYIEYHLAVPNKRIHTFDDCNQYYVLNDNRSRLLAAEFFYGKSKTSKHLSDKFKYYSCYYFLKNKGKGRLSYCSYLNRDVTINEKLDLFLCATASDVVGELRTNTASSLLKKKKMSGMKNNVQKYCETCIHYSGFPSINGALIFIKENLCEKYNWGNKYKYLVKWSGLL